MNYCSLEDAFQLAPGCRDEDGSKAARREERKKVRRCKGPAQTFLQSGEGVSSDHKDPDRQSLERPKNIPAMNSRGTGLRAHVPADAPLGMEPFQDVTGVGDAGSGMGIAHEVSDQRFQELLPRTDGDPGLDASLTTRPTPEALTQAMSSSGKKKSFFGADPADDSFADYQPDAKNYLMEPTFTSAFQHLNPGTTSSGALPVPSVRDIWKPLTMTGVDTSYLKQLPPPGGEYVRTNGRESADPGYQSMSRKMDTILARLDDLQRGPNPEQSQKEILLFVTSGVFVLFLMDLLVRKGSSLRFLRGL